MSCVLMWRVHVANLLMKWSHRGQLYIACVLLCVALFATALLFALAMTNWINATEETRTSISPMVKDKDGACIMMCGVHGHFHGWYVLRLRRDVRRSFWRQNFLVDKIGRRTWNLSTKWLHWVKWREVSALGAINLSAKWLHWVKWREVSALGAMVGSGALNYRRTEEFSTPEKKLMGNREGSNGDHW